MKVLISAPYMQPFLKRFVPFFEERGIEVLVPDVDERLEESQLLPWVADIDGVICGDDRCPARPGIGSPTVCWTGAGRRPAEAHRFRWKR